VLALVSSVNRPQLRINLDLYHTQIGEGDLVRWCEKCLPWIGEVQVADNPGRCEPGTGEINYHGVAKALKAMGYAGPVGLESFAAGDAEAALTALKRDLTSTRFVLSRPSAAEPTWPNFLRYKQHHAAHYGLPMETPRFLCYLAEKVGDLRCEGRVWNLESNSG
jgi:hypothetical protein